MLTRLWHIGQFALTLAVATILVSSLFAVYAIGNEANPLVHIILAIIAVMSAIVLRHSWHSTLALCRQ